LKFWKECAWWGVLPENWRIEKNWTEWVWPGNISYSMQMKEKICLTGFLYVWGVGHEIWPLHHDLQWSIVL
jgi:hypothetical protein